MLERLISLIRGSAKRPVGSATHRLCRLRHATLHPGATLWTPGVGGGNLGGGASSALDDAGVGGHVVVGFQASAREPVHPFGVIALLEERVPFPEGWSPEGLGATHRYRLLGLERVAIDPQSCTNKRVPTVLATTVPTPAEDLAPAPEALVALLQALSRLENAWPEHWLEAFRTLPGGTLGQWATTLGWRLSRDERLLLFDQPGKITEVLLSTLDGLHLGLAPERRREAVRVQTLTRRTTVSPERTLPMVVDEAGWALFHPADVALPEGALGEAGGGGAPSTGNAVTVAGAPGRRCRVRVTVGGLHTDEADRKIGEATFRLLVRHGRLFLGGASLLRAGYQDRLEFADPTQWIDVPNGLYRAVVTICGPAAGEPTTDAVPTEGAEDAAAVAAPPEVAPPRTEEPVDFVIQLVAQASLDDIVATGEPT